MALPDVDDCKDYLRIEHDAEDAMLAGWLAQAIALIEAELGRPITILRRTFVLECEPSRVSATRLFVPVYPIAVEDSSASTMDLTLTDADGTVLVEDTDYRLDTRTGQITGIDGYCFTRWPYTIVADVGLAALPEYATRIEPAMAAAVLDVVADRYQRRDPVAQAEGAGGGVYTQYQSAGLPDRVKDALAPWKVWHL
jgi:uncharacterized phiE125 gp8 family phage protein